jgi:hypothetical protein
MLFPATAPLAPFALFAPLALVAMPAAFAPFAPLTPLTPFALFAPLTPFAPDPYTAGLLTLAARVTCPSPEPCADAPGYALGYALLASPFPWKSCMSSPFS